MIFDRLTSRCYTLKVFRSVEYYHKKLIKSKLDRDYLHSCAAYNIIPKFLKFKLYDATLQNTNNYKEFQSWLLNDAIDAKKKRGRQLSDRVDELKSELRSLVSALDFSCLMCFVYRNHKKYEATITRIHESKIEQIGGKLRLSSVDPSKVIFNLSDRVLTRRERFLLSFGLDFNLPVFKLSFHKYFLAFENFVKRLENCSIFPGKNFNTLKNQIKHIAYKSFYSFKSSNVFSPIFDKQDTELLRNLGKDRSIIVCSPDKGRGVVILNRTDYIHKMEDILSDFTKFTKLVHENAFALTIRIEDKINRFLRQMQKAQKISQCVYDNLMASGTAPGVLYGLAKIHKPNAPLRPILAAYNTAMYKLAKFVVPLIDHLCHNSFTLRNSYNFFEDIKSLRLPADSFMVSFDVKSLYTNIPVNEVIQLICDKVFSNEDLFHNFNRSEFNKLLHLTLADTPFYFNNTLYKQVDGLSMGNPAAPSLANVFLCDFEERAFDGCDPDFKPLFYRRYLDDTFVIFRNEGDGEKFFHYLNTLHPNMSFTMEKEVNKSLSFLDLTVIRSGNQLVSSIFRKPTFTGLGTSYFSYIPFLYKLNAIKTLLYRAYHLSSNYEFFHAELMYLQNFFISNGFPTFLIDKTINKFLNNIFCKPEVCLTVPKQVIYVKLPFIGPLSYDTVTYLQKTLVQYFPQINFRFSLNNSFKVANFFMYKDRLPDELRSNIIYNFKCSVCNATYIGSTSKQSKIRFSQHLGISYRTNNPYAEPQHSAPRIHAESSNHPFKYSDFSIIDSCQLRNNIRILESIHIYNQRPTLNIDHSAVPLNILTK